MKNWASCQDPEKNEACLQMQHKWAILEIDGSALVKPIDDCSSADILPKILKRPITMNQLSKLLKSFLTT